ncbi:MAG: peptidoglycan bridge formation glycyltransferase FemA/FemB family protein [Pelolinea sp.]|nr:peptidoglycan bridge formation glycyltransferase FemA/FemB family protein [Pelolinea sp.]
MIKLNKKKDLSNWNTTITSLPGYSILQTREWGAVKSKYGWHSDHLIWRDSAGKIEAAALVLSREIRLPIIQKKFITIYIPQGPLFDWSNEGLRKKVLGDILDYAKEKGAFSVKIDPEIVYCIGEEVDTKEQKYKSAQKIRADLEEKGWLNSPQQIQFKNTAWIDLDRPEADLLSAMKQKTRYNVRLAERKAVVVREAEVDDLEGLYQMYLETSIRDGFIIRPKEYYFEVWSQFITAGMATPLVAEVDKNPVAGLVLFHLGERSWYIYGMSTDNHREKMPNYLLQWEAIKKSKELGCLIYDLWGAPDVFSEKDDLWGVYRFKQGLGCEAVQRLGAYDFPINKITYSIFNTIIPGFLSITRKLRKAQQKQELA